MKIISFDRFSLFDVSSHQFPYLHTIIYRAFMVSMGELRMKCEISLFTPFHF